MIGPTRWGLSEVSRLRHISSSCHHHATGCRFTGRRGAGDCAVVLRAIPFRRKRYRFQRVSSLIHAAVVGCPVPSWHIAGTRSFVFIQPGRLTAPRRDSSKRWIPRDQRRSTTHRRSRVPGSMSPLSRLFGISIPDRVGADRQLHGRTGGEASASRSSFRQFSAVIGAHSSVVNADGARVLTERAGGRSVISLIRSMGLSMDERFLPASDLSLST